MKLLFATIVKYLLLPLGMIHSLIQPKSNISVLMYHRVNNSINKEISVREEDFLWQMSYLKKRGFQVISLEEALTLNNSKDQFVVLTFDDGYEDYFTNAFPILAKFKFPSIQFLVAGYVNTRKTFWWDTDIGKSALMNWQQIIELTKNPLFQIGSHTYNHPDLNTLKLDEVEQELKISKVEIQIRTSKDVKHFAYPRGILTSEAVDRAKKHYASAVSIFDGFNLGQSERDLYRIKRMPVQRSDGRFLFRARLKGWLTPEEWLKKLFGKY